MHEHAGCKPFPSIRTTSFCSSAFRFCEQEELWQPLTNDGAKHRHNPTGTQRFFSRDATRQRPGRRGRLKSLRRFRFGVPCTHGSCAGTSGAVVVNWCRPRQGRVCEIYLCCPLCASEANKPIDDGAGGARGKEGGRGKQEATATSDGRTGMRPELRNKKEWDRAFEPRGSSMVLKTELEACELCLIT